MGVYIKKPVAIDALQFDGLEFVDDIPTPMFEGSFDIIPDWIVDARAKRETEAGAMFDRDGQLIIKTLEGEHIASPGDFIIRGVRGELYPCKPDIFAETYEAVR